VLKLVAPLGKHAPQAIGLAAVAGVARQREDASELGLGESDGD
jgi:hypothetical protein